MNRITKYHNGETPPNLPQDRSGMINYLFQLITQNQNQPTTRQSFYGIQSMSVSQHARNGSHVPLSVTIPLASPGYNFTPIHTPHTHYPDSNLSSNTNSAYSNMASPVIPRTARAKDPFGYEVEVVVPPAHTRNNTSVNNYFNQNLNGARNVNENYTRTILDQPELARSSTNPLSDYYSKNPFQLLAPEDEDDHLKQNTQHLENMVHEIERFIPDDISMDERQELEQCNQVNKRVDHLIELLKTYELQNELNVKSKLVSSHHSHTNSESLTSNSHFSSSENDVNSDILATVMSELVTMGRNPKNPSASLTLPSTSSSINKPLGATGYAHNLNISMTGSQKSNPNRNSYENPIPSNILPTSLKRDISGNMNSGNYNNTPHSGYNSTPNSGFNVAPNSGYNVAPSSGYNVAPSSYKANSHLNTSNTR